MSPVSSARPRVLAISSTHEPSFSLQCSPRPGLRNRKRTWSQTHASPRSQAAAGMRAIADAGTSSHLTQRHRALHCRTPPAWSASAWLITTRSSALIADVVQIRNDGELACRAARFESAVRHRTAARATRSARLQPALGRRREPSRRSLRPPASRGPASSSGTKQQRREHATASGSGHSAISAPQTSSTEMVIDGRAE